MNITINGREYALHFGIEFLRQVDKRYEHSNGDMRFGLGVVELANRIRLMNPVAIFDAIKAATATEHTPPTDAEIEDYLLAESTDVAVVAANFTEAFAGSKAITLSADIAIAIGTILAEGSAATTEATTEDSAPNQAATPTDV